MRMHCKCINIEMYNAKDGRSDILKQFTHTLVNENL